MVLHEMTYAGRKEEIKRSLGTVFDDVGRGFREDQVEDPVNSGADAHGESPNVERENLATVDPGDASVAEAEPDGPDKDEDDRGELSGRHASASDGRVRVRKGTDDPHTGGHDGTATDDHRSSTEAVGEQDHGNQGRHESNDAVNASSEQLAQSAGGLPIDASLAHLGAGGRQAERLEDTGRVVVDSVRSGHLEEDHCCQHRYKARRNGLTDETSSSKPSGVSGAKGASNSVHRSQACARRVFPLDLLDDRSELVLHVFVLLRQTSKICEGLQC